MALIHVGTLYSVDLMPFGTIVIRRHRDNATVFMQGDDAQNFEDSIENLEPDAIDVACDAYDDVMEVVAKPVTFEQRAALAFFAREYGRTWKSALREHWSSGKLFEAHGRPELGAVLYELRNTHGPSWLEKFKIY